jgi:hypothetical protein
VAVGAHTRLAAGTRMLGSISSMSDIATLPREYV